MRALLMVVGSLAVCVSAAAQATSLKDFWQSRPADAPRFTSTKSMGALEMCLGMEMSEFAGAPNVLHGDHETILTSIYGPYQNVPAGGFHLIDQGTRREVVLGALKTGGITNKLTAVAQRCI